MKLQIHRGTLVQVLQKLQGIAERKSNMPVLANVLLQASAEGRLSFSATDLELSYRTHFETDIEQGGEPPFLQKNYWKLLKKFP